MIDEPVASELGARLAQLKAGYQVVPSMIGSHEVAKLPFCIELGERLQ